MIQNEKYSFYLGSVWGGVLFVVLNFILLSFNAYAKETNVLRIQGSSDIEVRRIFQYVEATESYKVEVVDKDLSREKLRALPWKPLFDDTINLGFTQKRYWFKFEIKNAQNQKQEYLLKINYPVLDYLNLYIDSPLKDNIESIRTGDLRAFSTRAVSNRNFVAELEFMPQEIKTVYYYVETQGALQVPTSILTKESFNSYEQSFLIAEGAYFGIMTAMFAYFGFVYIFLREKVYLFFSLTVLFYTVFQLSMVGIGFQYIWQNFPAVNSWITPFSLSLFFFIASQFMIEFLRLRQGYRVFYTLLAGLSFVALSIGLLSLFVPYFIATLAATFLAVPLAALAIIISLYKVFKEKRSIKVFLGAWTFFTLFSIAVSLEKFGIFPHSLFLEHSMQSGSLLATLLLSLAIAERVRNDRFDKEAALQKVRESEKKEEEIRVRNQELQLEALKNTQEARKKIILAEAKSEAKSNFLAIMSHEIRTPMSGVLGGAKLLKESSLKGEQKDYLEMIESSGKALMSIINDILDYSKIEAGKMDIVPTKFELKSFCDECLASFRWLSKEKNLRFTNNLEDLAELTLYTDESRLRQVILNLLNNAFKFTKAGEVRFLVSTSVPKELKLKIEDPVLYFEISDTGIGIQKSQVHQLFQVFTQADSSTTREFGGSGLGLSICKKLVILLGGDIGVDSELGQGSKFWFTIAQTLSNEERETKSVMQASNSSQDDIKAAKKKVAGKFALIAEDNPVNQVVISKLMEKLSIDFELVSDGQQAVDRLKDDHQRFNFVLMDCEMPILDGYRASESIREWEAAKSLKEVPIIAITAHALDEHRDKSLRAGMNGHISKPIDQTKLILQIASLLD